MISRPAAHGLFDATSIFGGIALVTQSPDLYLQSISVIILLGCIFRTVDGGYDQYEDEE